MRVKAWAQWEHEVADRMGGSLVKASGSTDYAKGDVKTGRFLIDCKHTGLRAYTLSLDLWSNLSSWARNEGREPMVAVRLYEMGEPIDMLVVTELAYAERHPDYVPPKEGRSVRNKTLLAKLIKNGPYQFSLGSNRLVVCRFEEDFER